MISSPLRSPAAEDLGAPVVLATGLVKRYRRGDVIVPALRGVSLTQRRGEFVMVTGESGSGKSTLLNLCGCLAAPDQGELHLFGEGVSNLSDRARARLRRERIGFVFQDFHLMPVLSALENVAYALELRGARDTRARATAILVRVGLEADLHARVTTLSGGQMQRVAIARALVGDPSLVLADEPTANLDTRNKSEIMQLLHGLCHERGTAVLLVTHDLSLSRWADRILVLRDGLEVTHELQDR